MPYRVDEHLLDKRTLQAKLNDMTLPLLLKKETAKVLRIIYTARDTFNMHERGRTPGPTSLHKAFEISSLL